METALIAGAGILGLFIMFAAVIVAFGERQRDRPVGRYRLFPVGDGTLLLLDTKTGRLWERKAGSTAWSENVDAPWLVKTASGRR